MQTRLPKHEIVLLGAGHTNAHIIRMWRMKAIPNTRLTCVSDFPIATYSGMLPAVLAGQYPPARMQIDLVRLAAATGVRLIVGQTVGLDPVSQRLLMDGRPDIPYDLLSIGVGSVPEQLVDGGSLLMAIKPMQTFLQRLNQRLDALVAQKLPAEPLRLCVVGGGVGGVEVTLCLERRLRRQLGNRPFEISIVSGADSIPNGTSERTQQKVCQILERRGVKVFAGQRVEQLDEDQVWLSTQGRPEKPLDSLPADLVLWATRAFPPPVLSQLGLPLDDRGFLRTESTLQVVDHPQVFAVGDSGTIRGSDTPKAGVYAVRQGPILWHNLRAKLADVALRQYRPQSSFLKLLNTGDGRAIAEYGALVWNSRACLWLKDWIDGRFMDKYQDYEPMEMTASSDDEPKDVMRCAGCGGKIGGSILSRALRRLDVPEHELVQIGLDQPDDAAVVSTVGSEPVTATIDFFAAPLDDPYLVGRIATLNSASDLFAMGTRPDAALALATLPQGSPRRQEQLLYELLAGSLHELKAMGATLVGGHTTEGPQITIGFTMLAMRSVGAPQTKQSLRPGDQLILTKPLGTGALLAALMRARCEAMWYQTLLESMLVSNLAAAEQARLSKLAAVTDVTGFGLAGHLHEMLKASDLSCRLALTEIPVLPGALSVIEEGIESTLAPANRDVEAAMESDIAVQKSATYRLLFDPQTSGGLLLGVRQEQVPQLLETLDSISPFRAQVIGEVLPREDHPPRITVE